MKKEILDILKNQLGYVIELEDVGRCETNRFNEYGVTYHRRLPDKNEEARFIIFGKDLDCELFGKINFMLPMMSIEVERKNGSTVFRKVPSVEKLHKVIKEIDMIINEFLEIGKSHNLCKIEHVRAFRNEYGGASINVDADWCYILLDGEKSLSIEIRNAVLSFRLLKLELRKLQKFKNMDL